MYPPQGAGGIKKLSELEIDKDLDMGPYNITLAEGKTVDGVDVSKMILTDGISTNIPQVDNATICSIWHGSVGPSADWGDRGDPFSLNPHNLPVGGSLVDCSTYHRWYSYPGATGFYYRLLEDGVERGLVSGNIGADTAVYWRSATWLPTNTTHTYQAQAKLSSGSVSWNYWSVLQRSFKLTALIVKSS
jgi:hypothetical protein